MERKPLFDNIPDENLGSLLHQLLIVEGHAEVEVNHPTEGMQVVTKDNYKKMLAEINALNKLSPAKRILKKKQLLNVHQQKHRLGMKNAKFFVVDIQDEEGFGKDVDGNIIDMEEMVFIPIGDYLKGIKLDRDNEFGAFVHPENKKEPIRIIAKGNTDAE